MFLIPRRVTVFSGAGIDINSQGAGGALSAVITARETELPCAPTSWSMLGQYWHNWGGLRLLLTSIWLSLLFCPNIIEMGLRMDSLFFFFPPN